MALRVGTDLVAVASIEAALRAHGDRYLDRVYTEGELVDCRTARGLASRRLAACFAAKEAAMKVLCPDEGDPVPWRAIELRRCPEGGFELALTGNAAALAAAAGLGGFEISVSHAGSFASAVVVATYP